MTGNEHYEDGARESDESMPLGEVGPRGWRELLSSGPRVQLELRVIHSVERVRPDAYEIRYAMQGEYFAVILNQPDGTNVAEGLKRGDHVLVDDRQDGLAFFYGPVDPRKIYTPGLPRDGR